MIQSIAEHTPAKVFDQTGDPNDKRFFTMVCVFYEN